MSTKAPKSVLGYPNMVWELTVKKNIDFCDFFHDFLIFSDFHHFWPDIGFGSRGRDLGSNQSFFSTAQPKKCSISETIGSWASNRYLNPSGKHHTQLFWSRQRLSRPPGSVPDSVTFFLMKWYKTLHIQLHLVKSSKSCQRWSDSKDVPLPP